LRFRDRIQKKLIEVALPLEAINKEAAQEKSRVKSASFRSHILFVTHTIVFHSYTCLKNLIVLLMHLLTTLAKIMGPGGAKAIVADSLNDPVVFDLRLNVH
jgi:hypothetical protein